MARRVTVPARGVVVVPQTLLAAMLFSHQEAPYYKVCQQIRASVDYAAATASVVLKCPILTLHGDRTTLPRLGVGVVIALLEKLSRLA